METLGVNFKSQEMKAQFQEKLDKETKKMVQDMPLENTYSPFFFTKSISIRFNEVPHKMAEENLMRFLKQCVENLKEQKAGKEPKRENET